jgi:SAM-dependent methyltransferase
MVQRPEHLAAEDAAAFQDPSVAAAYQHRPPYPPELFDLLASLITTEPRRVLDVGCGSGEIARHLARRVEWLDAVDFSRPMIEAGQRLPGGDHPRLRWRHGRVEEVMLDPPYALVTAGASLHWMDWGVVLSRFQAVLAPGGYLAIVEQRTTPDPWSALGELIPRYRTDAYRARPVDIIDELERHGLFRKVGEQVTATTPFAQSVDDYIESYHSRSGFSRERMGLERAEAFDREARRMLLAAHSDGVVALQVSASVVWGVPSGGTKHVR